MKNWESKEEAKKGSYLIIKRMIAPPENTEIIEWPGSTMWFDENGILYSISKKASPQTIEESKKSIEDFNVLTKGKKVCMLIDVTHASPANKEARDFAARELPKLVKAMAILSDSPLGNMVANLFFGLKPPTYPIKMFSNENDAKAWLLNYI